MEVMRPETIRFKYQTLDGKSHDEEFNGLLARAIQHEMDHLTGKMIVDRVSDLSTIPYKKQLKHLAKESRQKIRKSA